MTSPLGARNVGQVSPIWTPVLTYDGGKPCDLTGVAIGSFSLVIRDTRTLIDKPGAGAFAYIENLQTQGRVAYIWDPSDTAKAGIVLLEVSFEAATGGRQDCDAVSLPIRER